MPRPPKRIEPQTRLLSSLDELLDALPTEDLRGDDVFAEKIVDLETWLYSPNYMNLHPVQLSPIQMQALKAMDDWNPETNRFTEFVLEWGKGSGKDFICALAGLRQVYCLLCMRNPYTFFGLAKNTGIQVVNVAYTKVQATEVFLKQVKGLLKGSPWFLSRGYREISSRIKFDFEIEFVSAAADGDSAEGQNMFFALMDEASAFNEAKVVKSIKRAEGVKAKNSADAIYDVLRSSTRSRFPEVGKVVMISYPRYRDDFIQTKRKEAEASENAWSSGPYATWEVNPRVTEEQMRATDEYKYKPEMAKAMYECKPAYSEDPYISFPARFIECVANTAKVMPTLENPLSEIGVYDSFFKGMPGRNYVIHVDLALRKDRCALTLARQGEPEERMKCPCNRYNWDGVEACIGCGRPLDRWIKTILPTMVVTLLKVFEPRQNTSGAKEVDFSDVRDEIMWIRDRGHRIWSLTYDGWQSVDSIQIMRKQLGFRKIKDRWGKEIREEEIANVQSVDRSTEAYDTLKEFIYDKRFFIAPPPDIHKIEDWDTSMSPVAIAYREWRALKLQNGKKIDHPLGGSKDFTDSLAGAAFMLAKMPLTRDRRPRVVGWRETPAGRVQ